MKYINFDNLSKENQKNIVKRFLYHDDILTLLSSFYMYNYGVKKSYYVDAVRVILKDSLKKEVQSSKFLTQKDGFLTSIHFVDNRFPRFEDDSEDDVFARFAFIEGDGLNINFIDGMGYGDRHSFYFYLSISYSGLDKDKGGIKTDIKSLDDVKFDFGVSLKPTLGDLDSPTIITNYDMTLDELLNIVDETSKKNINDMVGHLLSICSKFADLQKDLAQELIDEGLSFVLEDLENNEVIYTGENLFINGASDRRYEPYFDEDDYDGEAKSLSEIE